MKILIISQYFWPENFRINDLVSGFRERGHSISVLTGLPNYPKGKIYPGYGIFKNRKESYFGANIFRVPIIPRGNGGSLRLILNYISFMLNACILGPFYCRKKFDVIFFTYSPFSEGIPAILLKFIKKIPIIYWVQDLWPDSLEATNAIKSNWILKIVDLFIQFIYKMCNCILVQSQGFIPMVSKKKVSQDKIIYFPNSAEDLYKPIPPNFNTPEGRMMIDGFRIMFAGNIGAAQDFNTIVEAAEILQHYSEIHWIILGDGRMHSWVESEIKKRELSNNFHLLGHFPIEKMPIFFSFADVMLVTLKDELVFSLTIPGKVQSYLACGKPIIASLKGEGARVINEANAGIVCIPEDPVSLSEAVLKMYNMSVKQREMIGKNGRKYFESNFERNILLDRLEKILIGRK
jgi:colanic acid biosynthesis glycosyl transferase WcaI